MSTATTYQVIWYYAGAEDPHVQKFESLTQAGDFLESLRDLPLTVVEATLQEITLTELQRWTAPGYPF